MKAKFEKHSLRLREGDAEALKDAYPDQYLNTIIRAIISRHVDARRAKAPALDLILEDFDLD